MGVFDNINDEAGKALAENSDQLADSAREAARDNPFVNQAIDKAAATFGSDDATETDGEQPDGGFTTYPGSPDDGGFGADSDSGVAGGDTGDGESVDQTGGSADGGESGQDAGLSS